MQRLLNINTKSRQLNDAVQEGDVEKIRLLVGQSTNVNSYDKNGISPLHKASEMGQIDIIKLLLDAGASVNQRSKDDQTALHAASFHGHVTAVQMLIRAKAQVDLTDEERRTPLHKAVKAGHLAIVQSLINAKANVNAVDIYQEAALHEACRRGHETVVGALIAAGANVNVWSLFDRNTPLYLASSNAHLRIVQLLLKNGASIFRNALAQQTMQNRLIPSIENWLSSALSRDELVVVDWPASVPWILNILPRVDYLVRQEAHESTVPIFSKIQGQNDLLTLFQYLTFIPHASVKLTELQNELLQTLMLIKRKLPMELIDMIQADLIEDKRALILALPHLEPPTCMAILLSHLIQRFKKPKTQDFHFFQTLGLATWISEPPYISRAIRNLTIH